jgi:release factor glutamine methyltransferase
MSITIREALTGASFKLRQAGIDSPRREAEALLCACTAVSLAFLYAHGEQKLTEAENSRFVSWVNRRAGGEPYAYISGLREFMGFEFRVTPDVLIPRPETELLVETVLAELKDMPSPHILEVGTGSGAIAVSLAVLLPTAEVIACDLSPAALEVAAENAASHGVADRVHLLPGDLYSPLKKERAMGTVLLAPFFTIVSNPPYIPSTAIDQLEPTVRDFEPRTALDGGPDGLSFYRRLTSELYTLPGRPNLLAFEVGDGQAEAVAALCRQAGFPATRQVTDLAGIPRVITARPGR